jgi:hypothetical protein
MFNPVEWIVRPFKCVLAWAFIPDADALNGLGSRIGGAWQGSAPGEWIGAIGGIFANVEVAEGDCLGPAITFPEPFSATFYPIDACSGGRKQLADTLRLGIGVLGVAGGALACVQLLAGAMGYQIGRGGD